MSKAIKEYEAIGKRKYKFGFLKRSPKDSRRFELGGWLFGYVPKKQIHIIPTLDTKNQCFNSCTQEGLTLRAEPDEKVKLSEQSFSIFCKMAGVISQDGFSTLRAVQDVEMTYGIAEKELLDEDDYKMNYYQYTKAEKITPEIKENALLHKAKGNAAVIGRPARLKALDENRILLTGMNWMSGFNISNGFGYPWLIAKDIGVKLGGHCVNIVGYVQKYLGIKDKAIQIGNGGTDCYAKKNSFGPDWGATIILDGIEHKGLFFVSMDYFDRYGHSTYARIDLTEDTVLELIKNYEGKHIKASGNPSVYLIENGHKRPFLDKLTFYAFGGRYGTDGNTITKIANSLLNKIADGREMKIEESPVWEFIKDKWPAIKVMTEPDNIQYLEDLINSHK